MCREYGHEYREHTCKYCGEESDKDFCSKECAKAYELEN